MTEASRDEDLEQVMRDLRTDLSNDRPYIEKPDELTVDVGGGCFLDRHRICNAECVAYLGDELPTPVERCAVLSSATTGLRLLEQLVQFGRVDQRVKMTPPPVPPPFDKSIESALNFSRRDGAPDGWRR